MTGTEAMAGLMEARAGRGGGETVPGGRGRGKVERA